MTERQAYKLARRHPNATRAGWLLACVAPTNRSKGQQLLDGMSLKNSEIAIQYRDYCLKLYAQSEEQTHA